MNELAARCARECAQKSGDVAFYAGLGEAHPFADVGVGQALDNKSKDANLAFRQLRREKCRREQ